MEKIMLCCTICPSECILTVVKEGSKAITVEGNTCKRGIKFAKKEITSPERVLTGTVIDVLNHREILIPVKSAQGIPKEKMMEAMGIIRKTRLEKEIAMGEVIIPNILDTGIDIIACKTIKGGKNAL